MTGLLADCLCAGSVKLGRTCTAFISARTDVLTKQVSVEVCKHHVGHDVDLGHLRLTDDVKSVVAGKLVEGLAMPKVLQSVKENAEALGFSARDKLLNLKDVHNIALAVNVHRADGGVQKAAGDYASVEVWVDELNSLGDDSPVILYKAQGVEDDSGRGSLAASDFALGLQTAEQRDQMIQFGQSRIVCVDSTHDVTQYGFELTTITVVDDFGQGVPVAFLVSNRVDQLVFGHFFMAIQKHLPGGYNFPESYLMTDDAGQIYNAWVAVFGPVMKMLYTNIYVESFRTVLRTAYVERLANRRVDNLIDVILRIAKDKVYEQCVKPQAENLRSRKQQEITERHSVLLTELPPPASTSGGWMIPSTSTDKVHTVRLASASCLDCRLRCGVCSCCVHMYGCSCIDFAVHTMVCRHIHTVHHLRSISDEAGAGSAEPQNSGVNGSHVGPDVDVVGTSDTAETTALKQRLSLQCSLLRHSAQRCDDAGALKSALKHLKAANACLAAASKRKVAPAKRNLPPNKNSSKPLRFFSTKHKKKPQRRAQRKPPTGRLEPVHSQQLVSTRAATTTTPVQCSSSTVVRVAAVAPQASQLMSVAEIVDPGELYSLQQLSNVASLPV